MLFFLIQTSVLAHYKCTEFPLHLLTLDEAHTQSVGLLWTSDQPVAQTST